MAWYLGASILFFFGRFSHSCANSKVPPVCWNLVLWNSSWMIPNARGLSYSFSPAPLTIPCCNDSIYPTHKVKHRQYEQSIWLKYAQVPNGNRT